MLLADEHATLQVDVSGSSAGTPLLLIHGAVTFEGCRPLLAERALTEHRQVIHYYRRGYRNSSSPPEDFSIADQADDSRRVLKHLGIGRAHIVGHSIGAAIALQLAADHPNLVASLVLVEPTFVTRPELLTWFEGAIAPVVSAFSSGDRALAATRMVQFIEGGDDVSYLDAAMPADWRAETIGAMDTYFRVELPAAIAWQPPPTVGQTVNPPALVLVGGETLPQLKLLSSDVAGMLPGSQSVTVPHATHNVVASRPSDSAGTIERFVEVWV